MADTPERELPVQQHYPMFVERTPEAKHRWDLCVAVAADQLDVAPDSGAARMAAKVLYDSEIPS